MTLTFGPNGKALVHHYEGCEKRRSDGRFDAYPDPASGGDPWTIGWGSTGPDIVRGTVWTQAQCDARFARDSARFAAEVARVIGNAPTTQGQFDAMVSLTYNIGLANLAGSTLLARHRAGDFAGAKAQFARWNRAGGKVLTGLTRRRAAEAAVYGGATADARLFQQIEGGK